MRNETRGNLGTLLKQLRDHRRATVDDRRNLKKVMRDDGMQDEFLSRVREKFSINVDNLRELMKLFVEFAPQLLKIAADVIAMFAR